RKCCTLDSRARASVGPWAASIASMTIHIMPLAPGGVAEPQTGKQGLFEAVIAMFEVPAMPVSKHHEDRGADRSLTVAAPQGHDPEAPLQSGDREGTVALQSSRDGHSPAPLNPSLPAATAKTRRPGILHPAETNLAPAPFTVLPPTNTPLT